MFRAARGVGRGPWVPLGLPELDRVCLTSQGLPWDSLAELRPGGPFRKVHEPSLSLGLGWGGDCRHEEVEISPRETEESQTQTKTGLEAVWKIWIACGSTWIQPMTKPLSQLTCFPARRGP